jgi:hypothetical protein
MSLFELYTQANIIKFKWKSKIHWLKKLWFEWGTKLFWTIEIKQWLSLARWNDGFLFIFVF